MVALLGAAGEKAQIFCARSADLAYDMNEALRGALAGHYRIRTGDYRVQFFVDAGGNPTIEKVGHRDGFYDE